VNWKFIEKIIENMDETEAIKQGTKLEMTDVPI
jgi:hypothetical protein